MPKGTSAQSAPKQERAKKTYNGLLAAAQDILETEGYEALNSNAIVERAGMTPPAFYRYFKNKYSVLTVLCERLMAAQNVLLLPLPTPKDLTLPEINQIIRATLDKTVQVTREFQGGVVLLGLIRSLPELQPIRRRSHKEMSDFLAAPLLKNQNRAQATAHTTRAKLALEFGYAMTEMLIETGFDDYEQVLDATARSITALFDDAA